MLFLIVASAVLLVSYRLRVDIGDGAPLTVVVAFAALYCAALAPLVRPARSACPPARRPRRRTATALTARRDDGIA